jgi:hypothetical protein
MALLSTEAEYISLASGAQEVKFLQMLVTEIVYCVQPGILLEDNTGVIFLLRNAHVGQRTKHIDICWHYIRGMWRHGEIEADFMRSEDNESDICTKTLPFGLLKGFQGNIQNCTMNVRTHWDRIVKAAMSKSRHFAQKEDVMNWIQDWINHETDWINPVWSVQSPYNLYGLKYQLPL